MFADSADESWGPLLSVVHAVGIHRNECKALPSTGALHICISRIIVDGLTLRTFTLHIDYYPSESLHDDHEFTGLSMWCASECHVGYFSVLAVPYEFVLRFDWLTDHKVGWHFQSDRLLADVHNRRCGLPIRKAQETKAKGTQPQKAHAWSTADEAYRNTAPASPPYEAEETILFGLTPKGYKSNRKSKASVPIKNPLREAPANATQHRSALQNSTP